MDFEAVDQIVVLSQQRPVSKEALKIVGSRIRRMREDLGVSQEAFAQLAKLDRSYYGRIERGSQNLALTTLCMIAKALRVTPSVILADITLADCEKVHRED